MKLPSPSNPVKLDRVVAAAAAATALVMLLAVHLVLLATGSTEARMEHFGNAAVRALAELAVEPVMRQDRLHLGVIGNRLAETPEIEAVASYSSDNQMLASTGDLSGRAFTAPVTIDDSIVGYVRLSLHAPAFASDTSGRTIGLALAGALSALLVIGAWMAIAAVRSGQLALSLPRVPAWLSPPRDAAPSPRETVAPEPQEPELPPMPIPHYLLAVNLYNQLSLGVNERDFEHSLCHELAEAVAEIYQGQVATLPGTGLLLEFDHADDEDRAFQVLCAAFVLSRALRDESPFGQYRLGLNVTTRPPDEALPLDDEAIADAALLSALGRDGVVAMSAPFNEALRQSERFVTRPLVNPLLDELTTSGPACRVVTALEPPFDALAIQQAAQLTLRRDEISSPSTF